MFICNVINFTFLWFANTLDVWSPEPYFTGHRGRVLETPWRWSLLNEVLRRIMWQTCTVASKSAATLLTEAPGYLKLCYHLRPQNTVSVTVNYMGIILSAKYRLPLPVGSFILSTWLTQPTAHTPVGLAVGSDKQKPWIPSSDASWHHSAQSTQHCREIAEFNRQIRVRLQAQNTKAVENTVLSTK
jgi:hypothetical protein